MSASAHNFTKQEIMDGLRGLYAEWRDLMIAKEGLSDIRLPDYEIVLDQVEQLLP